MKYLYCVLWMAIIMATGYSNYIERQAGYMNGIPPTIGNDRERSSVLNEVEWRKEQYRNNGDSGLWNSMEDECLLYVKMVGQGLTDGEIGSYEIINKDNHIRRLTNSEMISMASDIRMNEYYNLTLWVPLLSAVVMMLVGFPLFIAGLLWLIVLIIRRRLKETPWPIAPIIGFAFTLVVMRVI